MKGNQKCLSEGNSIFDSDRVLEKLKTDYSNLLNSESSENFDNEHYESGISTVAGSTKYNGNSCGFFEYRHNLLGSL